MQKKYKKCKKMQNLKTCKKAKQRKEKKNNKNAKITKKKCKTVPDNVTKCNKKIIPTIDKCANSFLH